MFRRIGQVLSKLRQIKATQKIEKRIPSCSFARILPVLRTARAVRFCRSQERFPWIQVADNLDFRFPHAPRHAPAIDTPDIGPCLLPRAVIANIAVQLLVPASTLDRSRSSAIRAPAGVNLTLDVAVSHTGGKDFWMVSSQVPSGIPSAA